MSEKTNSSSDQGKQKENARSRLMEQLKMVGTIANMAASQGMIKTVRLAKPVIFGYTGCVDRQKYNSEQDKELPPDQLTKGEKMLLVDAGTKLAYESIELATLAYPPTEGLEPYRAVKDENGCYPAPHLAHLISLNKAIQDMIGATLSADDEKLDLSSDKVSVSQPVVLMALNGDEYGYLTSPIEPKTIRRVALNQRNTTLNQNS